MPMTMRAEETAASRDNPPSKARRSEPKARRARRGDDGIHWDVTNRCYVGTVSLGYNGDGKRVRRTVRGPTQAAVQQKLEELHAEIKAGIRTPATDTVGQCVQDWLASLTLDPVTIGTYRGQAEKWIDPKIGKTSSGTSRPPTPSCSSPASARSSAGGLC